MDVTIQHPWFKRAFGTLIPSRLFDQLFGEGFLEYDLLPLLSPTISPYYRQSFRSLLESGISEVRSDRDRFVVLLDVKHFSPEDLSVKLTAGDFVEIHGKHNEKQDDHGYVSREFHRRYRLPSSVDQSAITCSLSTDGMLTFSAPKILHNHSERSIPVSHEEELTSAQSS